jgi:CHAD domain-containing protein/transposase-like protein
LTMEIEAKFVLPDPETMHRLETAESLAGFPLLPGRVEEIHDSYLDTADRRIMAAGYACRKREQSGGILVTLKQLRAAEGAVHRREELQVSLASDLPPERWPDSTVRDRLLDITAREPLQLLFELSQTRVIRPVGRGDQLVAELSLDTVRLHSGVKSLPYLELEVELLPGGTEDDLAQIVASLREEWQVQPEPRSKFERALRFLGQPRPRGKLLRPQERDTLLQVATRADRHSRRAAALLALDEGGTQKDAGKRAGMSDRSVRHWLAQFRQERLGIFPPRILEAAGRPPETEPGQIQAQHAPLAPALEGAQIQPAAPEPSIEPQIELPKRPGLEPDDSMAEAARKTFYFHLQHMLYHEPGTRKGEDIEELHDMRVATRRMRAAARVFGNYLDPGQMTPFVKGLSRTGRALGAVRDLDVFRDKVQRYLEKLPPEQRDSLDPLLAAWQVQRQAAREKMLAYLDSERYQRFKAEFGAFLEQPDAGALPVFTEDGEPIPYRLRHVSPVAVHERLAEVRAYDEWVTQPNVPLARLHQLRIACKALRYTLEFFQEVLAPEAKALIDTMKKVQDHLGDLQDAVVACNLLRDFLTWGTWGHRKQDEATWPTAPVVAPGVATYMAVRQTEIERLVDTFPQAWSKIRDPEFHRLLDSALAVLW